jgi:hypothetical protein
MKKLVVATLMLVIPLAVNVKSAFASSKWVRIGVDSSGQVIMLDVNSIQNKPHASRYTKWFIYKISNRVNSAYTKDCAGGDGRLSWYVKDKQIWATSKTGVKLVETVCK